MTLLAAVVISLCLTLSSWQSSREQEKIALLQAWQAAEQLPVSSFPAPNIKPNQKLLLQGRYLPERQFLVDNRVWQGQVGYDVYTPLALTSGGYVLVNRGFIAAPERRINLPALPLSEEVQALKAHFYPRSDWPFVFGEEAETARWPIRIQTPDINLMARLANLGLQTDAEMRLLAGEAGALQVISPVSGIRPEKHAAYALQWMAFAFIAFVFWLLNSLTRKKARAETRKT